jgi:hypothetical protein
MPPLNNKLHEKFAWLVAEGDSHTEAYRKINPHVASPRVLAHKVYHRADVKSRIAEIRQEVATRSIISISRKREILRQMVEGTFPTKVVRNPNGGMVAVFDRLAALNMDAKIAGEFAPERHEIVANDLRLTFKIKGRNTNAPEDSDIMEAEIVETKTDDIPQIEDAPEDEFFGTEADLSNFENAPADPGQPQLDTL